MKTSTYATIQDLADYYHVSYHSIYKRVHEMMDAKTDGIIRIGKSIRVSVVKFEDYLRGGEDDTNTL